MASSRYRRYINDLGLLAASGTPLVVDDYPRQSPGRGGYRHKIGVRPEVAMSPALADHL